MNAELETTAVPRPSLAHTKLSLACMMVADARRIDLLYGQQAGWRLLGQPAPLSAFKIFPDTVDIEKLYAGRVLVGAWHYAYEGRLPVGTWDYELKAQVEIVTDFVFANHSDDFWLYHDEVVRATGIGSGTERPVESALHMANARLRLDLGDGLPLSDLALLARMTERSVRNALSASGPARLLVDPSEAGKSDPWIENVEARRWLAGRRGFVPTARPAVGNDEGDHPDTLTSLHELGGFIYHRVGKAISAASGGSMDVHAAAERFASEGITAADLQRFQNWSEKAHEVDPAEAGRLARVMRVDAGWLAEQILALRFPEQVDLLRQRTLHRARVERLAEAPPAADAARQEASRFSDAFSFVLHDGTELFPIRMRNRATGRVAFRLSQGGTGGNRLDQTIEVEDEAEMARLVLEERLAVRAASRDLSVQGLYRSGGRAVKTVRVAGAPAEH